MTFWPSTPPRTLRSAIAILAPSTRSFPRAASAPVSGASTPNDTWPGRKPPLAGTGFAAGFFGSESPHPASASASTARAPATPAPLYDLAVRTNSYGVVVDSVNVSVLEYVPVRSASPAPMCCLKLIVTGSLETGADQVDFENETSSGDGSANVPFIRLPGADDVSVASPAEEMTLAEVEAV